MTTETRLTYDEMRSNAEKIADANLKAAILAGMAVLQERYPDTWQARIDVGGLMLDSPTMCVLGQTYDRTLLTDEELVRVRRGGDDRPYGMHLNALNSDVEDDPGAHGFDTPDDGIWDYAVLTDAWKLVLAGELL